jgi:hypothetical protein
MQVRLPPRRFNIETDAALIAPSLSGADDTNSLAAPIVPWLRSLDGMNTHDLALKRSISGGVTTSLILPGSANKCVLPPKYCGL